MPSNKKSLIFIILLIAFSLFAISKLKKGETQEQTETEITPVIGTIRNIISSTGTVLPKNRLEIKPPVAGRIDEILVKEGSSVKTGQIVAWMSSTERAAILDMAQGKSAEELANWKEIYKAIPLISPMDGTVIVATTQSGQTVTTNDAVIVLSDTLIVRGQVDETDIGKIALGQKAIVSIDAYPEEKIKASVDHIYYESITSNNVTMYNCDLMPETTPDFFRSGMNASIDFIVQEKENVITIPENASFKEGGADFVWLKSKKGKTLSKTPIALGISDDKNIEVMSGLTIDDTVVLRSKKYSVPNSKDAGTNPFMPQRRRQSSGQGQGPGR